MAVYGVNLLDLILGTALLAIIPFLLAAYGGHVAAKTITDSKRCRGVILKFWGLAVVGIILAFWYQWRTTLHEQDRDIQATWFQSLILTQFNKTEPPPFWAMKTPLRYSAPRHLPSCKFAFRFEQADFREATNPKIPFGKRVIFHPVVTGIPEFYGVRLYTTKPIRGGFVFGIARDEHTGDPGAAGVDVTLRVFGANWADVLIKDKAKFSRAKSVVVTLNSAEPFEVWCVQPQVLDVPSLK